MCWEIIPAFVNGRDSLPDTTKHHAASLLVTQQHPCARPRGWAPSMPRKQAQQRRSLFRVSWSVSGGRALRRRWKLWARRVWVCCCCGYEYKYQVWLFRRWIDGNFSCGSNVVCGVVRDTRPTCVWCHEDLVLLIVFEVRADVLTTPTTFFQVFERPWALDPTDSLETNFLHHVYW